MSDTYNPTWSTPLSQIYTAAELSSVTFRFYDEDILSDDAIDSTIGPYDVRCEWANYPCSYTADLTSDPTSGLTSFTIRIEPN